MTIYDETLIYDCETQTFGTPDALKDRLKIFGCYSYKTKKYYLLRDKEQIQKIINAHKYLVGFNNVGHKLGGKFIPGYDNPILKREGIDLNYKIIIDLQAVFKSRASQMKIKEGMLGDLLMIYSLNYISKTLGIVDDKDGKLDIDYSVFRKETWSKEETKLICEYTKRDIEVTKKLYEWVEEYFDGFKPFLTDEDVRKKVYINSSIARFAYKAICKAMNWSEKYSEETSDGDRIQGGYVSYPAGEMFEGNIYLLDFNSLYPHCMIQGNLYGRKKINFDNINIEDRPIWTGGKWKINGTYYADKLSGVCELFRQWYKQRDELKKKKDRKEYTIKIILNASYGIMNNIYYENVYDRIGGADCTTLGRQWIKYTRKIFRDNGYIVAYTDTDSIYIVDTFNNKDKLMALKDKIVNDIKATVPFPQDTFDMGVDDEIKYLYFFKGKNKDDKDSDIEMDEQDFMDKPKGFMKKNYIYVTKDNEVVIKNLGIKKKSVSPLSRKIFFEHLVTKIKEGQIKFSKTYIYNLINELLQKDISLACMRKEVGDISQYSKTAPNSLSAQISREYGAGIHFLIPNNKGLGIGMGKKFCKLDDFKKMNLTVNDIDLDNIWKELNYFIKPVVTKNIFEF